MLILVTGEVGSGKTTACQRALDLFKLWGLTAGGILAPARYDTTGKKVGIDVLDVARGERYQLAEHVSEGGVTIGAYTFDQEALRQTVACVKSAIEVGFDVLFVDEIGPLELLHQGGLVEVLELLADPNRAPNALVVVRSAFAEMLERRLGRSDIIRIGVDRTHRDGLPVEMARVLKAAIQGSANGRQVQ
jgi:nucleoside-triphosphatase THEP1